MIQLEGLNPNMLPFKARRISALLRLCFGLSAGLSCAQDRIPLSDPNDLLNAMPNQSTSGFDFKIPPQPSGHILDTAHFLQPESLKRLESNLGAEAQAHGVDVYLLTIPSIQKGAFDAFTRQVTEVWTKDRFGAVIVFDDGTGLVSIQQSEQVTKRFYEFELSLLLKDAMTTEKRPRLSRAGLEHTTVAVKTALHELKTRANQEERKSLITRLSLGIFGFLAVLLGAMEYFRRRSIVSSAGNHDA